MLSTSESPRLQNILKEAATLSQAELLRLIAHLADRAR